MPADQEPDREAWLRNNFYFAYVTQYLNFFYPAFGLDSFTYHDLESLLLEEPDHITGETTNFFKKMLKTLPNVRINLTDNWIDALTKEYRKRGLEVPYMIEDLPNGIEKKNKDSSEATTEQDQEADKSELKRPLGPTFESFDLEMRLRILFDLCNFHHENPNYFVEHLLKGYDEGSNWRLEVLGRDSHQMAYWLFEDGRLYREKVDKANLPVDVESWELVAYNRKTWDEFLANGLSNKPGDRRLKDALEGKKKTIADALQIEEAYEASKAKALAQAAQKAFYDSLPRKRSSRLQEKDERRQKMLAELAAQEEEERRYQAELHQARTGVLPPVKPHGAEPITHGLSREERAELRRKKIEQEANARLLKELEEKQAEAERERLKNEALAEVDVIGDAQQSPKIKLIIRKPTTSKPATEATEAKAVNGHSSQKVQKQQQQQQKFHQKPTPSPELIQYLYQMQQKQLQMQQHQQQQHQQQQQLQQRQFQMQPQQQHSQMAHHPQQLQYQNQNPYYHMQYPQYSQHPHQMTNNPVQMPQYRIPMNQQQTMAPQGQYSAPVYPNHQMFGNPNNPPTPHYQFHPSAYTRPHPMMVSSQMPPAPPQQIPAAPRAMDSLLDAVTSQDLVDTKTPAVPNQPTMES